MWRGGDCTRILPTLARVRATSGLSWLLALYPALKGFSPGSPGFPLSAKINIFKFQFDGMQDLPENHFRELPEQISININYYY